MKTCTKCGETKELGEFGKKGVGLRSHCKCCVAINYRKWVENNKEHLKQYHKEWYENNKERVAQKWKKGYERIADRKRSVSKEWYTNNKERKARYDKKFHENNPGRHSAESFFNRAGLSVKDVPKELFEAKRLQILIQRQLKELEA